MHYVVYTYPPHYTIISYRYTYIPRVYNWYTTCIHLVPFSKAVYTTITRLRFLKRKNFPIVPVVCGCLLVGSTPPWGPDQQYSFIVYTFKNVYLLRKCVVYTTLHLSKYGAYILI